MHSQIKTLTRKFSISLFMLLTVAAFSTIASADDSWGGRSGDRPIVRSTVITEPGSYVLLRDITNPEPIRIVSSGVTLDLNGHQLTASTRGTGVGIGVEGATGVTIKNGRVGGFMMNVRLMNSTNVTVSDLSIVGTDLAPSGGPSEIGILLLNARASFIKGNTISNVNLGIFVRGGGSTGNRIFENLVVGGPTQANSLLGICYNPAPNSGTAGPTGDLIYNNHIARFGYAIAISEFSRSNIFRDNTLASYIGGIRETQFLKGNGGTNVAADNIDVVIPAN
jgi:parallel beta-helix repeat protein